jgi:uncharacterized protein YecT (DUF1311 family)
MLVFYGLGIVKLRKKLGNFKGSQYHKNLYIINKVPYINTYNTSSTHRYFLHLIRGFIMIKITSIIIITLGLSFNAQADSFLMKILQQEIKANLIKEHIPSCLTPRTYYDKVYCSSKVYAVLDDALNISYKDAKGALSKSQIKELKSVQVKWIRHRDERCASVKGENISINMTCANNRTIASLAYLHQISKNPADFSELIKEYENTLQE